MATDTTASRVALTLLLTMVAAADLRGQEIIDPDSVIQISPVSVTVLRTPLQMEEVPYAVSVNTEREIQLGKPGISVEEALRTIPGVQVENRFNPALGERISIRGFGSRSQFGVRGVRIFVDGIPATLPDGQSSISHVDVQTLGRVEVVRGPAASLYGNTAGGVIQMEMEDAPANSFTQEFGATGGSHGLLRLRSSTGGSSDAASYQVNFTRLETDGYRQHSAARNLFLNGRVAYNGERDRFRLIVSAGDTDAQNPGSLSAQQQAEDRYQAFANNLRFQTGKTVSEGMIGASWLRDAGPGEIEFAGYLSKRDVVNPIPFDIIDLDRTGGGLRALFRSNRIGPLGAQFSVGAEADRQRDDRHEYANDDGVQGDLQISQFERVDNYGVFGQVSVRPFGRLSVLAGLRYDAFEFSVDDRLVGEGNPDDSGSRSLDAFSPSFGLTYAITDDLHLYGNIGKTFETPTTVELGNRREGAGGLNPDLEPQEATSYEIGGRALVGQRAAVQLAAYHADVRNSLIPYEVETAPGVTYFRNAGSATHRGIELGLTLAPVRGLSIQSAYTYTDAKFDQYEEYSGNKVPGIAPHRLDTVLTYMAPGSPWYVSAENRYVDRIVANDANEAFSPAYSITEVRAGLLGVRVGSLTLDPFAGVSNVFDTEYNTSLAVNAFGGRFFESGPGRSFFVGGNVRVAGR